MNAYRIAAILALGMMAHAGCGDGGGSSLCNAATCAGCCDKNGVCNPWSDLTCGRSGTGGAGEACVACASSQSCVNGKCQAGPGICTPATCGAGCCSAGMCMSGQTAVLCGTGGAPCVACGAGKQCQNQSCIGVTCSASTCASGCCDIDGKCMPGTAVSACGKGGASCKTCASGEVCSDRTCDAAPPTCDATTCPDGCCDKGACIKTPSSAQCGKDGAACTGCGSSQECVSGQCTCTTKSCTGCCAGDACQAGSDVGACGSGGIVCKKCGATEVCDGSNCTTGCSAGTCSGCCNNQTCNFGGATDVTACGMNGVPCKTCGASEVCQGGTCNNPTSCDSSTCATGCCASGVCQTGTASTACGSGGAVCKSCAAFEYCGPTKSCKVNPTSTWKVTLQSIALSTDIYIGWDGPGTNPDPYLILTVGAQAKQSSTKDDTYTPLYNELLLTATAAELTATIKFVIWDEDYGLDDKVAECDYKFTDAQLQAGKATVYGCPSDPQNTYVLNTVFTFSLASP